MNETEKISLCNVLVLAMVDGHIAAEEQQFIGRLRNNLGVDSDEFDDLCEQVRHKRTRLEIPTGPMAAEQMLQLMMDVAKADGDISPDEQRILEKVAAYIDSSADHMEAEINRDIEDQ